MLQIVDNDTDLLEQFLSAEGSFLSAVVQGDISAFESQWISVHNLFSKAPRLQQEVISAANTVSGRIGALASSFIDINAQVSALDASFNSDMDAILHSVSSLDISSNADCNSASNSSITHCANNVHRHIFSDSTTVSFSVDGHSSRYGEAERWLLEHFHAPFPSASVKKTFAQHANATGKSINDWFTNARRKIGWTSFSKRYFRSDRSLTLDCAHRVLTEGVGRSTYCKEIIHDMEAIKATAERLYGSAVQRDKAEPSSFAKELKGVDTQLLTGNQSRQRRLSTCSTISEQSTVSYSSFSRRPSLKRSRDSSEESDATSLSEGSDARSFRPLKRGRNVSSSLSSLSRESSFTTCSSESNDSSPEFITPVSSPMHAKFPLELFDGWIDGISAEPAFLPHDLADKPPKSVLSHKRPLSDSDSDAPSKRARLERRRAAPVEKRKAPIPVPQPSDAATQPEPTAPSSSPSPPQVPAALPSTDDALSGQSVDEHVEEAVNQFVSQLDFTIPQAPVPAWDTSLLGISLEATLFDFSSFEMEAGSSVDLPDDLNALLASISVPDAPVSTSEEALAEHYAPQHNAQQESANELKNAPLPPNPSAPVGSIAEDPSASPQSTDSIPASLSSLDFDFLESLGAARQSRLPDAHTASEDDTEAAATLVDVSSSLESNKLEQDDPERAKKLERIDQLLAEAQRLQQEVFG